MRRTWLPLLLRNAAFCSDGRSVCTAAASAAPIPDSLLHILDDPQNERPHAPPPRRRRQHPRGTPAFDIPPEAAAEHRALLDGCAAVVRWADAAASAAAPPLVGAAAFAEPFAACAALVAELRSRSLPFAEAAASEYFGSQQRQEQQRQEQPSSSSDTSTKTYLTRAEGNAAVFRVRPRRTSSAAADELSFLPAGVVLRLLDALRAVAAAHEAAAATGRLHLPGRDDVRYSDGGGGGAAPAADRATEGEEEEEEGVSGLGVSEAVAGVRRRSNGAVVEQDRAFPLLHVRQAHGFGQLLRVFARFCGSLRGAQATGGRVGNTTGCAWADAAVLAAFAQVYAYAAGGRLLGKPPPATQVPALLSVLARAGAAADFIEAAGGAAAADAVLLGLEAETVFGVAAAGLRGAVAEAAGSGVGVGVEGGQEEEAAGFVHPAARSGKHMVATWLRRSRRLGVSAAARGAPATVADYTACAAPADDAPARRRPSFALYKVHALHAYLQLVHASKESDKLAPRHADVLAAAGRFFEPALEWYADADGRNVKGGGGGGGGGSPQLLQRAFFARVAEADPWFSWPAALSLARLLRVPEEARHRYEARRTARGAAEPVVRVPFLPRSPAALFFPSAGVRLGTTLQGIRRTPSVDVVTAVLGVAAGGRRRQAACTTPWGGVRRVRLLLEAATAKGGVPVARRLRVSPGGEGGPAGAAWRRWRRCPAYAAACLVALRRAQPSSALRRQLVGGGVGEQQQQQQRLVRLEALVATIASLRPAPAPRLPEALLDAALEVLRDVRLLLLPRDARTQLLATLFRWATATEKVEPPPPPPAGGAGEGLPNPAAEFLRAASGAGVGGRDEDGSLSPSPSRARKHLLLVLYLVEAGGCCGADASSTASSSSHSRGRGEGEDDGSSSATSFFLRSRNDRRMLSRVLRGILAAESPPSGRPDGRGESATTATATATATTTSSAPRLAADLVAEMAAADPAAPHRLRRSAEDSGLLLPHEAAVFADGRPPTTTRALAFALHQAQAVLVEAEAVAHPTQHELDAWRRGRRPSLSSPSSSATETVSAVFIDPADSAAFTSLFASELCFLLDTLAVLHSGGCGGSSSGGALRLAATSAAKASIVLLRFAEVAPSWAGGYAALWGEGAESARRAPHLRHLAAAARLLAATDGGGVETVLSFAEVVFALKCAALAPKGSAAAALAAALLEAAGSRASAQRLFSARDAYHAAAALTGRGALAAAGTGAAASAHACGVLRVCAAHAEAVLARVRGGEAREVWASQRGVEEVAKCVLAVRRVLRWGRLRDEMRGVAGGCGGDEVRAEVAAALEALSPLLAVMAGPLGLGGGGGGQRPARFGRLVLELHQLYLCAVYVPVDGGRDVLRGGFTEFRRGRGDPVTLRLIHDTVHSRGYVACLDASELTAYLAYIGGAPYYDPTDEVEGAGEGGTDDEEDQLEAGDEGGLRHLSGGGIVENGLDALLRVLAGDEGMVCGGGDDAAEVPGRRIAGEPRPAEQRVLSSGSGSRADGGDSERVAGSGASRSETLKPKEPKPSSMAAELDAALF